MGMLLLLLLAATPALADSVYVLNSDADAAQARVDLIQQAQNQILAAYFIFADDSTGTAALWLLRDAARRGLDVKLLIDGTFNRVSRPLLEALQQEGVEVRLYHKTNLLHLLWLTRRMHDKLLIIDGHHLITGGRNIEEHYFGVSEGLNYVDRDVYVGGEAAAAAQDYYLELWDSHHVQKLKKKRISATKLEKAVAHLDATEKEVRRKGRIRLDTGTDWSARGREVSGVRFFHDPVARRRKPGGIRDDLAEVVRGARESILVENPYLVPTHQLMETLRLAAERGVRVRILTNSLKVCDSVMAQSGYVGKRRKLVSMGVELWELAGSKTLHAKSAVVDGKIAIIGSYNLDPRSRTLNTEVAVAIEDAEIATITAESMERNLENAWLITPKGRPEGHKKKYPGASLSRRFRVGLYKLFLPLIRRQL